MEIQRREFIRLLAAFGVAPEVLWGQQGGKAMPPPAPVPWMDGINHANPKALTATDTESIAQGELQFFTVRQMETLRHLSDIFIPAMKGFPTASDAGTPLFLDFLLSKSSTERKQVYRNGVDWLDAQAMLHFKTPFSKVSDEQADQILRPWLRSWMSDHLPTELHAQFVNTAHNDIRIATENSSAWRSAMENAGLDISEQLFWSPVEPDLNRPRTQAPHVALVRKQAAL